ncbi:MAG: zinc-binding dehydrogenase [Acidimicrobiales bacterium]|jgi:L-iditol 2-dehydrogenase
MRAVQLHGVGDLRVDDLGELSVKPGRALIRVGACGVCPSEVRSYNGARTASAYEHALPRVLGHEWAGVVEEVVPSEEGSDAPPVVAGQLVAVDWRCICGRCAWCSRGRADLCEHLRSGCVQGGFSDVGVAPLEQLYPFPAGVAAEAAAFTEPLACVLNGQERLGVELGADLVVLGCGPMGLLHVQLGKARGARVIACDPIAERTEVAAALGADDVVAAAGEEAREEVRRLTENGAGADAVVVAVGVAGAVDDGIAMAAKTGRVNVFAGTFPPKELPLDPNRIHYPQIAVTGTHDYTPHQFRRAGRLIARGVVSVQELISHRGGLDETVAGFERIVHHEGLKTMILPNG